MNKLKLQKKRQCKEVKRNLKRKRIRALINGGKLKPMSEHQRYLKALFQKAIREGKIKLDPNGKLIVPSLSTSTANDVKYNRETDPTIDHTNGK